MNIKEYIDANRGNAVRLATALGISTSYVSQLANGHRSVSPTRAVQIEVFTHGVVSRKELRGDWQQIWPEAGGAA